jgi:hypothetical protein
MEASSSSGRFRRNPAFVWGELAQAMSEAQAKAAALNAARSWR